MEFIDREFELEYLRNCYERSEAQLVVVYGRRRVGKTELIREFARNRNHLFVSCDLSTEKEQLRQFSQQLHRFTGEEHLKEQPFTRWEPALEHLFRSVDSQRRLVIIDEFPYLCHSNKALPSILQKVWDAHHHHSDLFLVLCGSHLDFMRKEVLGVKSPLYGRRTGQVELDPMPPRSIPRFFPDYSPREWITAFAVLGGVPAYLSRFDGDRSIEENIRSRVLSKNEFLFDEVRFLLMEEVQTPNRYFSILAAIAAGHDRLRDIADHTGFERGHVSRYLAVLRELGIVRREIPVTEDETADTRSGRYRIADHFFRFWFRYVFPNRSLLEEGDLDYCMSARILPDLDEFVHLAFLDVCADVLRLRNRAGELPFRFHRLGGWWFRDLEVDLVGRDLEGNTLLVDCAWGPGPVGKERLEALLEVGEDFGEVATVRGKHHLVISRDGLTPEAESLVATRSDLEFWGLSGLGLGREVIAAPVSPPTESAA
ncbi:MAG: ATP-binding protein [Planctomycetota bacterium]|jgi:hypothetical protein|nr:ATP-binding protein [Planctomycetota bacterium]